MSMGEEANLFFSPAKGFDDGPRTKRGVELTHHLFNLVGCVLFVSVYAETSWLLLQAMSIN